MCEYCNIPKNVILMGSIFMKGEYDAFNKDTKKYHKVNYSSEVFINKKIKFCPMCGEEIHYES